MRRFNALETPLVTRINVTPIIDVALVLVIILLVTAPIMSVLDMGIDLPQARTQAADDDLNLCVTLGPHGELAIGEDMVSPAGFVPALRARIAETKHEDVLVLVRADAAAPHGSVKRVLSQARQAGAQRIGIATRQRELRR